MAGKNSKASTKPQSSCGCGCLPKKPKAEKK